MTDSAAATTIEKKPIECPICGNEGWINVDEYRLKLSGMCMCSNCGFITYPEIVEKAEELKEHYRKEYRPGPSVQNVFTGQRKLHYHANFLHDWLTEWQQRKLKNPVVFEAGAAFGMFLDWIRKQLPGAQVYGTELTLSFRRVAYQEYGIVLDEEFDDTRKYDLIASYKVAEHIPNIHKELRRYALSLKDTGFVYISVPTWFHSMTNFGTDGFALETYYDKNHINVWTRKHFETLLKKCGLEVVKTNYVYYDSTYLCKRNDALMEETPVYEETEKILEVLGKVKKAAMAFDASDFAGALQAFPAFPDAHLAHYEQNRAHWHQKGFEAIERDVIQPALDHCPASHKVMMFNVDLCMRYGQIDKAMEWLKVVVDSRPGDPGTLVSIAHCYRELAKYATDPRRKVEFIRQARDMGRHVNQVSLQHSLDSISWIFADDARLPMPGEEGYEKPTKKA